MSETYRGRPRGVLAILGATATGKSALAVDVAERLDGEVISADAFTAYRGLDAATAKPTPEERRGIPHHLIDVKDPREPFSAGEFAKRARAIAEELLERGKLPILTGGTGFYVRAFFDGLFEGPTRNEELRRALDVIARRRGKEFLKRAVDLLDPASGARVSAADTARHIRLLEIAFATGQPPARLFVERKGSGWERPSVKVLLTLPRPTLYERIENRFATAFSGRLTEEVQRLLDSGVPASAPGFSAIGYRETVDFLSGRLGRSDWEERIVRQTRRYAKRQETWFRHEAGLIPFQADRSDLIDQVVYQTRPLFMEGEPR